MTAELRDIPATAVVPSERQIEYQRMELLGFVHFTVNTFTDLEWGDGSESPSIFAPAQLDADQWARIASEVGMGQLILTAKHHDRFSPANLLDGDPDTYWAAADGARQASVEIDLGAPARFDRILLQEAIRFGQRIASFIVEVKQDGTWRQIASATTIGHKRLLRIDPVETDAVRISVTGAMATVALSNVGLYLSSPREV